MAVVIALLGPLRKDNNDPARRQAPKIHLWKWCRSCSEHRQFMKP